MKYHKLLFLFFLIVFFPEKSFSSNDLIEKLKEGGKIVMIRHAYAPGNGDPENFSINDCSSQRNLNKEGLIQSKLIGNFLKLIKYKLIKFYQANGADVKTQLV